MKTLVSVTIILLIFNSLFSQPIVIDWQQCFGGSDTDEGYSILQVSDGYLLFCNAASKDGQVPQNHGKADYWLVKTDFTGVILWSKIYGGSGSDFAVKMLRTNDYGYLLLGFSESVGGQVSGNHGDFDLWLVKVDSVGDLLWQRCFGGTGREFAYDMILSADSGYLLAGMSNSNDGDVTGNHGFFDCWFVKINKYGDLQWQKSIGGSQADIPSSIEMTADGGCIVGASTHSDDGDVVNNIHGHDSWEVWILRLDNAGNILWQKCYGGTGNDGLADIILTSEHGLIFTGPTESNDGDVSGNHGNNDIWVVKIDSSGMIQWHRCYGGYGEDNPVFIRESANGSFLLSGYTYSWDGDVSGNHSLDLHYDAWLVRILPEGGIIWQRCVGSYYDEYFNDYLEFPDGKMTFLGYTSTNFHSGDVLCDHHGGLYSDIWLVGVTDSTVVSLKPTTPAAGISIYPNPAEETIWISLQGPVSCENTRVIIVNMYGQTADEFILPAGQKEVTRETDRMPAGFYTCVATNQEWSFKEKLLIIK